MKRILVVLFLIPSLVFGAYTEFYCQNGGSNLNSGSTTNNTATYTSASGNWVNTTAVFTPTDGSTPASSVNVGDFASVYVNGSTATAYVGRVSAVGAGVNGTITVPNSAALGSKPANQTGTATIKVGGAWKGPNAAVTFPVTVGSSSNLVNTNGDPNRLNFKNDQTYSMTAALTSWQYGGTLQGYTSSPGDGGRATFDFGTTTGNFIQVNSASVISDLIITSSATSGAGNGLAPASNSIIRRVTATGWRGAGFSSALASTVIWIECEANNNNKSNTVSTGGFNLGTGALCVRCIASGNTGSNTSGFIFSNTGVGYFIYQCVAFGNGKHGFLLNGNVGAGSCLVQNDAYNNGGDAFHSPVTSNASYLYLENNNALKNTGSGFASDITTGHLYGWMYNFGLGSGTEENVGGTTSGSDNIVISGTVTYTANKNPYTDPANGNFTLIGTNTIQALSTGRGAFTETQGGFSGTTGYNDIGAANHNDTCGGTGPCQTSGASSY